MIKRAITEKLYKALQTMPVVALIGPRQVGKTTLAQEIGERIGKPSTYLDMELDSDFNKFSDPEAFLSRFHNELLIIDEVQRKPDLFRILRGLVDIRKKAGERSGHFLLLGSASRDLLQQSSESLAGRIRYMELSPFSFRELHDHDPSGFNTEKLWLRGGFPDSYLASSDEESWNWRSDFISTYVERDIPLMGPAVSSTRLKRFWTMLSHYHGQQINFSELGRSLEVSHTTIRNYLDTLTDFYMVRQIQPWSGNTRKRLIKSPKIYIRDSGLLHRLLNISGIDILLGHPAIGASWEGFVLESIITQLDDKWQYTYYRSSGQAEIDLVIETPLREIWAIEVKRSIAPKLTRGFYEACQDIQADKKFVIYSGSERYPMPYETEVLGLSEFLGLLY